MNSLSTKPSIRTIIEEKCVQIEIDKAREKYPILDEIFRGLTWRMAREPEAGHVVMRHSPSVNLIKIDSEVSLNRPGIIALYTYNDNEVTILSIKVILPNKPAIKKKRGA